MFCSFNTGCGTSGAGFDCGSIWQLLGQCFGFCC